MYVATETELESQWLRASWARLLFVGDSLPYLCVLLGVRFKNTKLKLKHLTRTGLRTLFNKLGPEVVAVLHRVGWHSKSNNNLSRLKNTAALLLSTLTCGRSGT